MSTTIEEILAPISAEMEQVEAGIARAISDADERDDRLTHLLRDVEAYKGKRLRPALVILSGKCLGRTTEQHIKLAVAVELIHTAALIHDDIIDGATMRRSRPTTCFKWGPEISVVLGDFLLSRAFRLIVSLNSLEATRMVLETTQAMCEGELRQLARRYDFDLDEQDYLKIIEQKTAALWATCCKLGAMATDASNGNPDRLARYGLSLGIAFQIIDDCLDLIGDETVAGKTLRTDIRKGKLTLPLIHLSSRVGPSQRRRLKELILGAESDKNIDQLLALLSEHGSIEYSMERAKAWAGEARRMLSGIPDSRNKEHLLKLSDYVVERRR